MAGNVAVIGSGIGAAQAALTLAELGVEVSLITPENSFGPDSDSFSDASYADSLRLWPLLLRAASHPLVTLYTNSRVEDIKGKQGKFTIRATKQPRYVRENLCSSCGRCEEACSVKVRSLVNGQKLVHSAIHAPLPGSKAVPSAYYIEKNGIAPCRAACPLGIKVQGFISLLSKGKVDDALNLINEAAPLASILGRVCTHPCENNCKRGEVDKPVFIQALHRYSADNASGIRYTRKAPAGSRKEKIAIVGSGPSGLTAAWELARRGYMPTIFESHATIGGMLATGIPRFRLPREVREREVEAIKALGVDMKTGITVGRDVTLADLRERGFKAFFLAIGAQKNNKLNIPGEDLEGVVDGISLLFALNQKVGVSVGSNIVVIGGGNSAVDSARTAKRSGKGSVRILYRRTAGEMTAVKEDIEEAIKEGITIEYLTSPVEIIGDGTRVTGIRCQKMKLGEAGPDGRRMPEPIPGSESVIKADHVVVAIGQFPDTVLLNSKGLAVNSDATVQVDPLTLETNLPGVFAGGDCIMGPNNVVEAMANGLRAAESIDRYLRGHDLRKGRSLEKPQPAEVDVKDRIASKHRRAAMPSIHHSKRMGSYEETSLGLPREASKLESERCLNCAMCSECLECEEACELGAVFHKDNIENLEIDAGLIINFISTNGNSGNGAGRRHAKPGIHTVRKTDSESPDSELARAAAAAFEAATALKQKGKEETAKQEAADKGEAVQAGKSRIEKTASPNRGHVGLVLCSCGGSISSIIDFEEVAEEAMRLPNIFNVLPIAEACIEEAAQQIADKAVESKLGHVVLAACRCCNLEQICFSCTDRRIRCQSFLSEKLAPLGVSVEFVNIREQCAWAHREDTAGATRKALDIIRTGIAQALALPEAKPEERAIETGALVLGTGLAGLAAANALAAQGYSVTLVSRPESEKVARKQRKYLDVKANLLKHLEQKSINNVPWPDDITLEGAAGSYEAVLKYHAQTKQVKTGALVIDLAEPDKKALPASPGTLLARLIASRAGSSADIDSATVRDFTIKDNAGIFIINPAKKETAEGQVSKGIAAAARAAVYLSRGILSPRKTAVIIDSKLCRGCGDCAAICPYIEMKLGNNGTACAYIDPALCLGCGACISRCPTGAIAQPAQSDRQIISALEALLEKSQSLSGAR
ncbi:MAG: 4Fe-4S dicluster domain-containing protein [Chloroflexi bacterium]|nr:4Fe-4S dicluster domain-containing protein [Chloroflexota bacterium]